MLSHASLRVSAWHPALRGAAVPARDCHLMVDNAKVLLMKQLKDLNTNPVEGFSAGLRDDSDAFIWEVMIMGPPNTPYEGGIFNAEMIFPKEYPNLPPTLKFTTDVWHPNVHVDGKVCIDILHPPGDDQYGYESAAERWLPMHTVESILISVLAMLCSPNADSPANIDAAKEMREGEAAKKKLRAEFAKFDLDGSGTLTFDELVGIFTRPGGGQPVTEEEAKDYIKKHDKNGDGVLDIGEFITSMGVDPFVVTVKRCVARSQEG